MEEEGEREAGWEEEEEEEEAEVEPKARDAFDRKNKSHRNKKKKTQQRQSATGNRKFNFCSAPVQRPVKRPIAWNLWAADGAHLQNEKPAENPTK